MDTEKDIQMESVDENTQIQSNENIEAEKKSGEQVPLQRFLEEKKKRKELDQRVNELTEKLNSLTPTDDDNTLTEEERVRETVKKTLEKHGYSGGAVTEWIDSIMSGKKPDPVSDEVQRLKKEPFYEDISEYVDEINEVLEKNPNLTVKNAYDMLRAPVRTREMIEKQSLLYAIRKNKADEHRQPTQSQRKNETGLDPSDATALSKLQEMYPDDKWTEERYLSAMKRNGIL